MTVDSSTLTNSMMFLILIIMGVYVIFAFLVTRQVKLMNNSFKTPLAMVLQLIANIHLFASVIITFIAVLTFLN